MLLAKEAYRSADVEQNMCLAMVPDFNTLIAKSQDNRTPVFALTGEQIGQQGVVLKGTLSQRDTFREQFNDLADKIIKLSHYGNAN
jgi:hypothetical protein